MKGSGRTLNLGIISFQPAELAKISLILFTAKILGKNQKTKEHLKKAFIKIIIHAAVVCGLIFISDFSTSAFLFATIMTMMFVGRVPLKYLFLVFAIGVGIVASTYFTADIFPNAPARVHTIKGRIDRFIHGDPNSEKGITQADYAKLAIYEGGIFGKGPGHSDVSNYMAAAYNDFIFAIIVEEYGLMSGIVVILLYLIFFFRSVVVIEPGDPHVSGVSGYRPNIGPGLSGYYKYWSFEWSTACNRTTFAVGQFGRNIFDFYIHFLWMHFKCELSKPDKS